MKKITNFIISTKLTLVLLLVFAVAIGAATFIENEYDTETANFMVYRAKWFEFVMLLLAINFIGNIKRYSLFSLRRAGGFLFHIAFVILIIGAGITRYFGFEGTMHIREGESSNSIYTDNSYLQIMVEDAINEYSCDLPLKTRDFTGTPFSITIDSEEKGTIEFEFNRLIKNAVEKYEENVDGGVDLIELTLISNQGNQTVVVKDGDILELGNTVIAYNNDDSPNAVKVTGVTGALSITSPFEYRRTRMSDMMTDTVKGDFTVPFDQNVGFNIQGNLFVFTKLYNKAKESLVSGESDNERKDALIVDVILDGQKQEVPVFGGAGYVGRFQEIDVKGITLKMAFGTKPVELPFSIFLNDFILDRYAGSMSPSSFASEVTLIDERNNLREDHRIFMNNVLDYKGYRFFQSSYDQDEKGTVLSVNHDFYGTWVSYFGYLLLGIGFVITMLNRSSRFFTLRQSIKAIRAKRKAGTMALFLLLGLAGTAYSQGEGYVTISEEHAGKFSQLITQTYDGRFQPVHSLAYDVIHKISRRDKFDIEGSGTMDATQVFMDMLINPEFWKQQEIIYVREESVRDILGIKGKYASFLDFYEIEQHDQNLEDGQSEKHDHSVYKLQNFSETAFRKKQSKQNKFDKEIIKVDERINICIMIYNGSLLKIFPEQCSLNKNWVSWDENPASIPLTGAVKIINENLQLQQLNYNNIFRLYVSAVMEATRSGDYSRAEEILGIMGDIQRNSTSADILPTQSMVEHEIKYNESQIFSKLKKWYGLLSVVLLLLAFIDNIRFKKSKVIGLLLNFCILLLLLAFVYHTYGIGMRWYLTGHAPWSNGYEALLLMAWAGLLAGFSFVRNSKITLAATALFAFFILMTAGHSSYDPQLTNLQPVLKSNWLIYHVAVITISYGFLGLGFILGIFNLFIYLFKTNNNAKRIDLLITELTEINEINLSMGVMLVTIGTFLGGIWANESWGRYWGWDAKETWSLVIVMIYSIILHFRLVPALRSSYLFNVASVLGFGSVIMTFIGVNYYLSKGLHSYASGDTPAFPVWAWGLILSLIALMIAAGMKEKLIKK